MFLSSLSLSLSLCVPLSPLECSPGEAVHIEICTLMCIIHLKNIVEKEETRILGEQRAEIIQMLFSTNSPQQDKMLNAIFF